MANVFGILTALLLAVAAFVAHKNTEALNDEIETTKNQQASFDENKVTKKGLEDDIAALDSETATLKKESEELAAKLDSQNKSNTDLEGKINENESLVKEKEDQVSEAKQNLADLGEIPQLVDEMKATQKRISDLTNEIGVQEAKLSQQEQSQASLGSSLDNFKETNRLRRQKQAPASLNTRVRSVYSNWGFVTIAAGDDSNVIKGSILQVLRNGEPIAKLKVTSVEARTAAADVVKDSLKEGESVSAGDIVVASIKQEKVTPAAPSKPIMPAAEDDEPAPDANFPADDDVEMPADADAPADDDAPADADAPAADGAGPDADGAGPDADGVDPDADSGGDPF